MAEHPANFHVGKGLFDGLEQGFLAYVVPRIPAWVSPNALTFASFPLSAGIVGCGFLVRGWGPIAPHPRAGLVAMAVLIVAQWFTDSTDGALGRLRKTGMIRWGYYMDHLLDFFFLSSVFIAYGEMIESALTTWIMIAVGAHMISSYLVMGVSQKFQISHYGVGPTEARALAVVVNVALCFVGVRCLVYILPGILAVAVGALIAVVFKEQRELRRLDVEAKKIRDASKPEQEAAASLFLH